MKDNGNGVEMLQKGRREAAQNENFLAFTVQKNMSGMWKKMFQTSGRTRQSVKFEAFFLLTGLHSFGKNYVHRGILDIYVLLEFKLVCLDVSPGDEFCSGVWSLWTKITGCEATTVKSPCQGRRALPVFN